MSTLTAGRQGTPAWNWRAIASLLLLCGFLLAPLGYPGYFQPHSGFLPVYTLYAWEAAGHPIGSLSAYSPTGSLGGDGILPYTLAALFRAIGADGPAAVKGVYALALVLGALGAYALFGRRREGRAAPWAPGAIALALVWAYSPMSVTSVYVRGSLGGSLALGLLPWFVLALAGSTTGVRSSAIRAFSVVAGLAIGLAHPGFALVATVGLVLAILCSRGRVSPWPLIGALVTVGVGLIQGLPQSEATFLQFALPYQWLGQAQGYAVHSAPWGPGLPAPLTLGLLPVGLFAAGWLSGRPGSGGQRPAVVAAIGVLLLALAAPPARPLWEAGLARLLDGPWQLIALVTFMLVWAAAPHVAHLLRGRGAPAAALGVVALVAATPFLDVPLLEAHPASRPMASFDGGRVLLVGAELHGPLRHGATPKLRLLWQATEPIDRDYTVFVHVVDDAEQKWGQRDSWPGDGSRPTTTWRPGEVVVDDHPVYIRVEGPRDGYHLVIGLYDLETGARLPLGNGSSALELGREG